MSRRTERVSEQVRAELARLLREEVSDPRIGLVTLTRVDVSADFGNANVFWSALPTKGDRDDRERAVSWVRKEAALKALGIGLRTDPAGLRTPPSGIPADLLGDGAAKVTVHDLALPWPDAAAAVAVAGQVRQVDVRLR